MIKINKDSGVDTLLEILRQSQEIKANIEKNEKDKTLDSKKADEEAFYTPRVSLRRPDRDKNIILSRKKYNTVLQRNNDAFNKTKSLIEGILNRMTVQDYKMLSEEGFMAEDLTIEALTLTVEMIKDYTNKSKEIASNKRKEEKKDTNKIDDNYIKRRMEDENLPVSNASIERINKALDLSESIPHMDKKDILYLFKNELKPTIENLYKAKFSKQNNQAVRVLSDNEWTKLLPQVSEIIGNSSDIKDNDILNDSKWLIENNIPLTTDNISLLTGLKDLTQNYSKDKIFDRIISGMKAGDLPGDVVLIDHDKPYVDGRIIKSKDTGTEERLTELLEDIHAINEDEIIQTVEADREITIKNLIGQRSENISTRKDVTREELPPDYEGKVITAKRQLEEIRLKMTLEVARRMENKGFHIETESLEKVVERLRIEEKIYYEELYNQAKVDSDEARLRLLQLTSETMDELKVIPAHVLGKTLIDRREQTVSSLLTAGRDIITELDKAREAYETLFTEPRPEYGDSIQKAFSNISSLMEEMGIENTEYNQRAIRILGYNRMEITKEAIDEVKAYDLSVNYLIKNLNPAVAIQIIKDGLNPLDVPIDKLNSHIELLKEQGHSSLDKYSSYLYKLEQKEGLSEDERKAYIGIYRLLHHIEKSDGAAVGALIKSGQEVTLNHLLMALRTSKRSGMDYRVNDEFGSLQELSSASESITDQLGAIFHDNSQWDIIYGADEYSPETSTQEELQNAIIKELVNSLTPEKLDQLHKNIQNVSLRPEGEVLDHNSIWETIGNMPTEQLLDYINGLKTDSSEDQSYHYERLSKMQEVLSNSDQAIRLLNNLKLPCTTTNLMMAGHLLSNSGTVFKKLFGIKGEMDNENEDKSLTRLKNNIELSDTLIDNETMVSAYEELEQEVKALIEEETLGDNMDSNRLSQLKSMGMEMHFLTNLAKREFYQIPIEASGKITNVNLTIIRGKASGGKVAVTLLSEKLGNIKAEASLKENKLSGYIACDHIGSLKILENLTEPLELVAQEENITIKQLNFCLQQASDSIYSHQNSWDSEGDKSPETERVLYRLAKAMIHMVRSAEEVDSAVA